jgi:hypothetical protein
MIDAVKVRSMIPEEIPDESLNTAIDDTPFQMIRHGVDPAYAGYDQMARLMVCHLLFMRGWGRVLLSAGVGDLNTSYADMQFGDKESMSPYLYEFLKLHKIGPFVQSV